MQRASPWKGAFEPTFISIHVSIPLKFTQPTMKAVNSGRRDSAASRLFLTSDIHPHLSMYLIDPYLTSRVMLIFRPGSLTAMVYNVTRPLSGRDFDTDEMMSLYSGAWLAV